MFFYRKYIQYSQKQNKYIIIFFYVFRKENLSLYEKKLQQNLISVNSIGLIEKDQIFSMLSNLIK